MSKVQVLFNDYIKSLEDSLSTETDLYKYEEQFSKLHKEFGRKLLEHRLTKEDGEKKEYKKNFGRVLE
jgi:hypothetical protein